MSRRKRTSNTQKNIVNIDIDYEKLAQAIVKAQNEVQRNAEREKEKKHKEWQQKLGLKNPPTKLNRFCCGLKLLMHPKKYYTDGMNGIEFIMSLVLTTIFWILELLMYFTIICLFVGWYINSDQMTVFTCLKIVVYIVSSFLFGKIFNTAKLEIDNMNDDNKLISIFSAVITFIAMLGTILSVSPMIREVFIIGTSS